MPRINCATCNATHEQSRIPRKCQGIPKKPKIGQYYYVAKIEEEIKPFDTIGEFADFLETSTSKVQNIIIEPEKWYCYSGLSIKNMLLMKISRSTFDSFISESKKQIL